jgi:hypothetical protein
MPFMSFDLTRGEIILVAFIFGLIYSSGFLPRLVNALAGKEEAAKGD